MIKRREGLAWLVSNEHWTQNEEEKIPKDIEVSKNHILELASRRRNLILGRKHLHNPKKGSMPNPCNTSQSNSSPIRSNRTRFGEEVQGGCT